MLLPANARNQNWSPVHYELWRVWHLTCVTVTCDSDTPHVPWHHKTTHSTLSWCVPFIREILCRILHLIRTFCRDHQKTPQLRQQPPKNDAWTCVLFLSPFSHDWATGVFGRKKGRIWSLRPVLHLAIPLLFFSSSAAPKLLAERGTLTRSFVFHHISVDSFDESSRRGCATFIALTFHPDRILDYVSYLLLPRAKKGETIF